jgi:leader peptidase (prepilin peptidase)/N-methyltransferase
MELFYSVFVFIFGLLIGSFLNVVILRLPKNEDLVFERSHCPQCKTQLKWYHNIPVLSFVFLRGQCAFCGTRISWRYPLIELLTGLIAYWLFPNDPTYEAIGMSAFYFFVACLFICQFFIDLDHQLLLDKLNIYLAISFFSFAVLHYHWTYWAIGSALGFFGTLGVTWLFYKIRGQIGLGGGDIKLFGILGLYLGPTGIMMNIFLSCLLGASVGIILIALGRMTKDKPLAFGPAIILVACFQIYFPDYYARLLQWFL